MTLVTAPSGAVPAGLRKKAQDLLRDFAALFADPEANKDALPQETKHGAAVIFITPDRKVLLIRRSSKEANYAGHWALPGGMAEPDESPEDCAKRECEEEIGGAPDGGTTLLDDRVTPNGFRFRTYVQRVEAPFECVLNEEHDESKWTPIGSLPDKIHPAVRENLVNLAKQIALETKAADDALALDDLPTVREIDRDGHMHIARTPITRAVVSPYLGREIAGAKELGLDPDRRYNLYRDADELAKGMNTLEGKPLLLRHRATSADDHPRELTIGAVGGPVVMEGDTVYAPLTIWDSEAIKGIESGTKRGLSAGYFYQLDLSPGRAPDGTPFDGRMIGLDFNHLAIVSAPRVAGALVADSTDTIDDVYDELADDQLTDGHAEPNPYGIINQEQPDMTISAAVARRTKAVTAFVAPRLAKDQSIDGLAEILAFDAEREEFEAEKRAKETEDKKAKDAAEAEEMAKEKEAKDKRARDEKKMEDRKARDAKRATDRKARDESEGSAKAFIKSKMEAEDAAKACSLMDADREADDEDMEADDEADEPEEKMKGAKDKRARDSKPALDEATIDQKIERARAEERARQSAIYEAREFVRPWTGELTLAFDSADAVLAAACKHLKIDTDGVNAPGLKALIKATPRPGAQRETRSYATDSTARDSALKHAPGLGNIRIGA